MKILIAGAGIGGLSAALCLQQAGHEVQVFEQAAEFSEVGAGLQCGANALRVLEHLGLLDELKAVAVAPHSVQFRHYASGAVLHTMHLGDDYEQSFGAPYLHVHRADLHSIMASALASRSPGSVHFDSKVAAYSETPSGVTLRLEGGSRAAGDCLVAADGLRSVIRDQLLGERKPEFTGMVAWRGVVPVDRLPENWMETVTSNFMGPAKHAVLYYLRNRQLANFVGVVENAHWQDDSWVSTAPWSELQADFAGWNETVQQIIAAMDKDQCYRWALHKHAPFDNWSSDRVTLLGDAAHATLPFMAAGAALALEDARVLDRALSQAPTVGDGLQLYQRNRLERTAKVQRLSKQMGALYHINNSLMRRAAFKGIQLFGARSQAYLPDYDANTVELI